jgi:hypothetical protein
MPPAASEGAGVWRRRAGDTEERGHRLVVATGWWSRASATRQRGGSGLRDGSKWLCADERVSLASGKMYLVARTPGGIIIDSL